MQEKGFSCWFHPIFYITYPAISAKHTWWCACRRCVFIKARRLTFFLSSHKAKLFFIFNPHRWTVCTSRASVEILFARRALFLRVHWEIFVFFFLQFIFSYDFIHENDFLRFFFFFFFLKFIHESNVQKKRLARLTFLRVCIIRKVFFSLRQTIGDYWGGPSWEVDGVKKGKVFT